MDKTEINTTKFLEEETQSSITELPIMNKVVSINTIETLLKSPMTYHQDKLKVLPMVLSQEETQSNIRVLPIMSKALTINITEILQKLPWVLQQNKVKVLLRMPSNARDLLTM